MTRSAEPSTALIGAGKLARALAPLLVEAGYPIVAVASRDGRSARRLCRELRQGRPGADPVNAARAARLVLLAVPDRQIAEVARLLAGKLKRELAGRTVIHHAGAMGIEPLSPVIRAGASAAVLHPLQCLGSPELARRILPGSRARIEGDPKGAAVARRLARDVGLVPLRLPARLSPADRELYHAAASLASNDLLALLHLATRSLEKLGLGRDAAVRALLPILRGTLEQAAERGLRGAFTGPVARGDAETLASHLRRLARRSGRAAEVHRLLSRQLLDLAAETGDLSRSQRSTLHRLLS